MTSPTAYMWVCVCVWGAKGFVLVLKENTLRHTKTVIRKGFWVADRSRLRSVRLRLGLKETSEPAELESKLSFKMHIRSHILSLSQPSAV